LIGLELFLLLDLPGLTGFLEALISGLGMSGSVLSLVSFSADIWEVLPKDPWLKQCCSLPSLPLDHFEIWLWISESVSSMSGKPSRPGEA